MPLIETRREIEECNVSSKTSAKFVNLSERRRRTRTPTTVMAMTIVATCCHTTSAAAAAATAALRCDRRLTHMRRQAAVRRRTAHVVDWSTIPPRDSSCRRSDRRRHSFVSVGLGRSESPCVVFFLCDSRSPRSKSHRSFFAACAPSYARDLTCVFLGIAQQLCFVLHCLPSNKGSDHA